MDFVTIGQLFHPGMIVPLWCNPTEQFLPEHNAANRFRLVLFEEGTGMLNIGGTRRLFMAPSVFCLGETESVLLEPNSQFMKAHSLFFDPNFINSSFTFENLRHRTPDFLLTDIRDSHWLKPFFQRKTGNRGVNN